MNPLVSLGVVLVVVWAFAWLFFKIVSGLIHILLVIGLAMIIWGLIKKGARAVTGRGRG